MRFHKLYGSHPLHLLIMLAALALLGYVVVTAKPATLWKPEGAWWQSIVVWFAAAIIAHDLVLFPIYALADRLLGMASRRGAHRREPLLPVRNHIRVPALGSGLLLLIFFPGIIKQGAQLYVEDTGLTQEPFFGRWLLLTAAMFAVSAVSYTTRLTMTRLRVTK
ncbi:MAG: hypothetical protein JO082_09595 [Mycobacterium sp.]|nr:hypothetical protein [Mycobacterium sp.]